MPISTTVFAARLPIGDPLGSDAFHLAVQAAVELQVARVASAFSVGGHHLRGGEAWAPLAESTRESKRRRGKERILIDTGRLRSSIRARPKIEPQGVGAVLTADTPYAGFHQFGTRFMPARPPLVMTEADVDQFADDIRGIATAILNGGA